MEVFPAPANQILQVGDVEAAGLYRRREVAELLGVTPTTVAAAGDRHEEYAPTHWAYLEHGTRTLLYDEEAFQRLRAYLMREGDNRGRPRLWSSEERVERRKQFDLARYYRRRAGELQEAGRAREAARAERRAEVITQKLSRQHDRRVNRGR